MAKINYEYDSGKLPEDPDKWPKRLRLAAIFVAIAAVTGGLIYWIIPKDKPASPPIEQGVNSDSGQGEDAQGKSEDRTGSVTVFDLEKHAVKPTKPVKTVDLPVTTIIEGGEDTSAVAPKESEKTPVTGENVPDELPITKEDPLRQGEKVPEMDPQATAYPEKGKPWVGDAPEPVVLITPVRPEESAGVETLEKLGKDGDFVALREKASALLNSGTLEENSGAWRRAAAQLTAANAALLTAGKPLPGLSVRHTVAPGESYSRLAQKNRTTIDAIRLGSRQKGSVLRVGQRLEILPGPWSIRVEKGAKLLKLYNHAATKQTLFGVWDIGIGRNGSTPPGKFVIFDRLVKPAWTAPDGRVYPYGDPENQVGSRFLKLAPAATPTNPFLGLGIHGTPDESTVTRSLSSGCIRMRNAEVEFLFMLVPVRTPVEIID